MERNQKLEEDDFAAVSDARSNRVSIYRIKDPTLSDRELVKDYDEYWQVEWRQDSTVESMERSVDYTRYYARIDDKNTVYVKQTNDKPTRWSSTFFLNGIQLYSKSHGAAQIAHVVVDGRPETYVIAFGSVGRFIVDPDKYDDRFGIKTALSVVDSGKLKQIEKNEFTGSNRITQQQISKGSSISSFEVDPFGDYLKSVTGDAADPAISKASVKGGASLSLTLDVDVRNMVDVLEDITRLYRSEAYKKHYGWIDNLYLVSDRWLADQLFKCAVEHANNEDGSVWFAVPDMVNYDEVGFFRYLNADHHDVELHQVLKGIGGQLCVDDLAKQVTARSVEDQRVVARWMLRKCLCGEVQYEGELYGVSDGKWFRIEKAYADRVAREYEAIDIYTTPLDAFDLECDISTITKEGKEQSVYSEGAYLRRMAKDRQDEFVLLDQELVQGMEVCDLVARDALIHVKRYRGSSAMSHAFFQGLNSATMLEEDEGYLEKANEIIATLNSNDSQFLINKNNKKDVVFAVIGKDEGSRPHLPLFSKVSLCHAMARLRGLGFGCKIAAIPIVNDK